MNSSGERITRMRRRYQREVPRISVERAGFYTEKWRELEGLQMPQGVRVALCMKHVYENMTHNLDPDDRIAGAWTEFFLGLPLDIERGLFNGVLATEMDKLSMLRRQAGAYWKFLFYMIRKHGFAGLYRNMKMNSALGPSPVNFALKTLGDREINAFYIAPEDRSRLKHDLLPYWEGRCIADIVADEINGSDLFSGDMVKFISSVPSTPSKQVLIVSNGASICTYQGHLIMDHGMVLEKGLTAVRQEVQDKLDSRGDQRERDFLQSLDIAIEGVIVYATRLAERIERELNAAEGEDRRAELSRMLQICRKVPLHPAQTFREAVQGAWTLRTAVELANITNVHAFGRLDQLFDPYYQRDLERGLITREESRELMEELLLKVMTQNLRPESNFLGKFYLRYEGSTPITLGGLMPDGRDATKDMTYVLLEAAGRSKTITSLVVRMHDETPDELYLAVADVLHDGTSNLSMMNDEVFVGAMRKRGFTERDSRDYAVTGCTDLLCPGKTGGISFSGLLLARILDITLRNGDAQTLIGPIREAGIVTGDPDGFSSFDELLDAYIAQADHQIRLNVEASNLRDRLFEKHLPAPHVSAFIQGCTENMKDITSGGAVYNFSGINMINSVANVVDSLYVIKKLVFEQKRFTIGELLQAVDANFAGYDEVLKAIGEIDGRWGNANPETDELAAELTARLFAATDKYRAYRDGPVVPFINSMTSHTIDGRLSGATPDGRRAATPYASSCNPYNIERAGLTGVLKSVSAIDFSGLLGCAVNVKMHPSALGNTDRARLKWAALMRTYFKMGGAQVQPTVASAEMLREAQRNPDAHRDLIVKVGGYSTYFVDLGPEIQNEVISRTEHEALS